MRTSIVVLAVSLLFSASAFAQTLDATRFRELREKSRTGKLTDAEKTELDALTKSRTGGRPAPPSSPPTMPPTTPMPPKPG